MQPKKLTWMFSGNRADNDPPCSSSSGNVSPGSCEENNLKSFIGVLLLVGVIAFPGAIVYGQENERAAGSHRIVPPEDRGYLAFPLRIMNRSTYDAYHFDPETDESAFISYTVSKTGWVRVRLVRRDNNDIVLRTIQQWTASRYDNKRQHQIEWDGKDATGNRIEPGEMFILFEARDSAYDGLHETHSDESCTDPEMTVSTRASVDGGLILVVRLKDTPERSEDSPGLEARVYLDEQLFETLQFPAGARTFTFSFEPTAVSEPGSTITVNLDDGQDHIGVARIYLNNFFQEDLAFR